jgi:hypothetical protein
VHATRSSPARSRQHGRSGRKEGRRESPKSGAWVQGDESEVRKQQLNIKGRDERVVVKSRAWNNALCCSEWLGEGSRRASASANVNWSVRFEAFVDLIVETRSRRPQNTKSKYATIKVKVQPRCRL